MADMVNQGTIWATELVAFARNSRLCLLEHHLPIPSLLTRILSQSIPREAVIMNRGNLYKAVFTGLSVIVLAIGGFGQGKGHGGGNPHGGGGGGNPHGGGDGGG